MVNNNKWTNSNTSAIMNTMIDTRSMINNHNIADIKIHIINHMINSNAYIHINATKIRRPSVDEGAKHIMFLHIIW